MKTTAYWRNTAAVGGLSLIILILAGCVERTVRIETDPPGARVIVNDEEVGVSPVKFSFLWYGDYEFIIRKPGYKTLKTHRRIDAPWYQYPPFDLVAETMVATTIRDEHVVGPFVLQPAEEVSVTEIVQRAEELRGRALFESD